MRPFRVGTIRGIELRVDPSWIFVFLILTWSLGATFGTWHPQWGFGTSLTLGAVASLCFFASVVLHELAHCVAAKAFGIEVRDITLHLFGGLASIEGSPASPRQELAIAIVGPAVSFLVAFGAALVGTVVHAATSGQGMPALGGYAELGPVSTILLWLATANFVVAVFNLLPGLPLDGGRVLRARLWSATGDPRVATRGAAVSGQVIGYGLILAGIVMILGARLPLLGQGLGAGAWTAFVGWFLKGASRESLRVALLEETLDGVHVRDLMRTRGPWVTDRMTVADLVRDVFVRGEDAVPVFEGSTFVGLVRLADVLRIGEDRRALTLTRDAMTKRAELATTTPDEPAILALRKMSGGSEIVVLGRDGVTLAGMLLSADVARWVELHRAAREKPRRSILV